MGERWEPTPLPPARPPRPPTAVDLPIQPRVTKPRASRWRAAALFFMLVACGALALAARLLQQQAEAKVALELAREESAEHRRAVLRAEAQLRKVVEENQRLRTAPGPVLAPAGPAPIVPQLRLGSPP